MDAGCPCRVSLLFTVWWHHRLHVIRGAAIWVGRELIRPFFFFPMFTLVALIILKARQAKHRVMCGAIQRSA